MSKISPRGKKRLVECTCLISLAFLPPLLSLFKFLLPAPPCLIAAAHCSHMTIDSEPEWLYNDPSFFRGTDKDEAYDVARVYDNALFADVDWGFRLPADPLMSCLRTFQQQGFGDFHDEIRVLAIDVPGNPLAKGGWGTETLERRSLPNTEALDDYLRGIRSREFAKKRLMYVTFP
jgi:hypothetical protein